jgi:hypothetical protein
MVHRDAPLSVEIPAAGADRPIWGKAGVVAAAGFVIGIAWPHLTSTRIAPSPPGDNGSALTAEPSVPASAAGSSSAAGPARSAATGWPARSAAAPAAAGSGRSPGPSALAKLATAASATAGPSSGGPSAGQSAGGQSAGGQNTGQTTASRSSGARDPVPVVGSAFVYRCRNDQQELTDCGPLQFDGVAVPRIKGLSRCPAARGANGKLSLGLEIDFRTKTVHVLLGKSTNLPPSTADALLRCADAAFDQVSLSGVAHDHPQYTIFYAARFGENASGQPGNEKPSSGAPAAAPPSTDGSATIVWDVAQLRETPKTGAVVERLLKGAKVKVLAHDGSWYRVQYGTLQAWIYREAIGL